VSMKLSQIILTFNRKQTVERVVDENIARAESKVDELIWCDNGSTDGIRDIIPKYNPDVVILNRDNLGSSKGYNRAIAMTTGDYILHLGCDILFQQGWLRTIREHLEKIPNTGMITIPCEGVSLDESIQGSVKIVNGCKIQPIMCPTGVHVISRKLWKKCGYYDESFGLYGNEDCEWIERARRDCPALGLMSYWIVGFCGVHQLDSVSFKVGDKDYWDFKVCEARNHGKNRMCELSKKGFPYFNPYM
jgi:glycosyltransferase involved in cell wall biosynthesis